MRGPRIKGVGGDFYHCMSRVIERRFLLGPVEKEKFRSLLRQCEAFCGVRVLTYTILSNHFHILLEIPRRLEIPDEDLVSRIRVLYGKVRARDIEAQLATFRAADTEAGNAQAQRLKEEYTYRMGDVSEFFKTLKQRFTQWYNRRNSRKGTLWEERFKSVLVEGRGHALLTMAAYIDLNAVRAGLVVDPKEYRFGGYAEAVAGVSKAREGLARVLASLGQDIDWPAVAREYRKQLFVRGEERKGQVGVSAERVKEVLESQGRLTPAEILRCRVRYFSDGIALGSREFVDRIVAAHRERFGTKRTSAAREMRYGDWYGLCIARDLRLAPILASPDARSGGVNKV